MQRLPSLLTVALLSIIIPFGCSQSETHSDVRSAVSSSTVNQLHGRPAAFGFIDMEDGQCDCNPPPIVTGKSSPLEAFRAAQNAQSPPPRNASADQPLDSRPIDV